MRIAPLNCVSLVSLVSLAGALSCTAPHDPVVVVEGGDDDVMTFVFDADESTYDADGAARPQAVAFSFARVGVRFTAERADALELRTSVDGAAWSAWAAPAVYFSEEHAHAGHLDVVGPPARFVQHRAAPGSIAPTFVAIEPVREIPASIPAMVVDDADDVDGIAAAERSSVEQGLNVTINSRASWNARPARCRSFTGVRKATIHHTADANDDTTSVAVQLRQIQAFHQNTRGWCDIGYNFLVSRDGRLWEGRGYGVLGAHTENANSDNMGICFMGTYTNTAPPMVMQASGAKLLRYLHDRAGIPLERTGDNGVKGHRQRGTTATTCPGDALYARLAAIVTMAKNGDFDVGPPVPTGCRTGNFDGEFCDDDGSGSEASHNRLKTDLAVNFHCANIEGEPAFCGTAQVSRAQSQIFVLGKAAGIPTAGHPNAFTDDNGHTYEKYMDAAKAYGIFLGSNGKGLPDGKATRDTLAVIMKRMYLLPNTDHDYFDDDDGTANEAAHNSVAAAGLFTGYADANGGRKDFKGTVKANRDTLAILAVRAADKGLVPVWDIPQACLSGTFVGNFCDDDTNAVAQATYDRLIDEAHLPGMFCTELAGSPRFCAGNEASRAMSIVILGGSAGMPLTGHPNAFTDDEGHPREAYLDAAKAYGIFTGYDGGTTVKPSLIATRDTLATMLVRMYALPESTVDAFTDDNGSAAEATHNKVAAAGLFTGTSDDNGGFEFRGAKAATKGQLATLAQRAQVAGLIPVWVEAQTPPAHPVDDPAPADDTTSVGDDDAAPVDLGEDDAPPDSIDDPAADGEALPDDAGIDDHGAILDQSAGVEARDLPPAVEGACNNLGGASFGTVLALLGALSRRRRR